MKMIKAIPLILIFLITCGCALPLTDRRHFDPDLEKRERDLMIRKDFVTGEEKRLIEKDIDRIQNNYIISAPEDLLEMIPTNKTKTETEKAIDDKIMRELERSSKESQKK